MADKLLKVRNNMKYNIGVVLLSGAERNILAGSFTMLTADDIEYINSLSVPDKRPFTTGRLSVESDAETKEALDAVLEIGVDGISVHENQPEIEKKLKSNINTMKKWLSEIRSEDFLFEVVEVAKTLDLPASKVKLIQELAPYANLVEGE